MLLAVTLLFSIAILFNESAEKGSTGSTSSEVKRVDAKVGIVCVQDVEDGFGGGGAFPMDAVTAARMMERCGAEVKMIDSGDILDDNVLDRLDVIIFGGGYSVTYTEYFAPDTQDEVRNEIREFISNGGGYIGLCAGGFFAADVLVRNKLGGIRYEYYLDLFHGDAKGPISDISEVGDPMAYTNVRMVDNDFSWQGEDYSVAYLWGPYFTGSNGGPLPDNVDVVGRYDYEVNGEPGEADNEAAMIKFNFDNGKVFLSGPHPEQEESEDLAGSTLDWTIGDDYSTENKNAVGDPDSEFEVIRDILAWMCPNEVYYTEETSETTYNKTAAVYAGLGTSARVVYPTMKMLYSLGIQPYAFDSHAEDEIDIEKFDICVFPNGYQPAMEGSIKESVLDNFMNNGGDFIGIGGGAKMVGYHLDYWDDGQDLEPPAQHGMETITMCDNTIGSGNYTTAYYEKEESENGHHWDGSEPSHPGDYSPISWEDPLHFNLMPNAVPVAYFTDEGSDQVCMVRYPYGDGNSRIFLSTVDLSIEEESLRDGSEWENEFYNDPESEWPITDNVLDWMGY